VRLGEIEYFKCPWCEKTIAFGQERHEMLVGVTKEKPPTKRPSPYLLISRKCDRNRCSKTFWVEVYKQF
jgi:hypothetical protein